VSTAAAHGTRHRRRRPAAGTRTAERFAEHVVEPRGGGPEIRASPGPNRNARPTALATTTASSVPRIRSERDRAPLAHDADAPAWRSQSAERGEARRSVAQQDGR
jgi:hypothetical protein